MFQHHHFFVMFCFTIPPILIFLNFLFFFFFSFSSCNDFVTILSDSLKVLDVWLSGKNFEKKTLTVRFEKVKNGDFRED